MKLFKLDKPICIFALNRFSTTDDIQIIKEWWPEKAFIPSMGYYKGELENSYILAIDPTNIENEVFRIQIMALMYGQESILYSDQYRNSWLIDCKTNKRHSVGKLQRADKNEALQSNCYTELDGSYWITA